jgi:hypothetical protein
MIESVFGGDDITWTRTPHFFIPVGSPWQLFLDGAPPDHAALRHGVLDIDIVLGQRVLDALRVNTPDGGAVILLQEAFAIPIISFADARKPRTNNGKNHASPAQTATIDSKSLHSQLGYKRL